MLSLGWRVDIGLRSATGFPKILFPNRERGVQEVSPAPAESTPGSQRCYFVPRLEAGPGTHPKSEPLWVGRPHCFGSTNTTCLWRPLGLPVVSSRGSPMGPSSILSSQADVSTHLLTS